MIIGVRTCQKKQSGLLCSHHGGSPRLAVGKPASSASLAWEDFLVEAGQQGRQEPIRVTAALGSSCRRHPVPQNKPSPPRPSSDCQWPKPKRTEAERPSLPRRRSCQGSSAAGTRCLAKSATHGEPDVRQMTGETGQGLGTGWGGGVGAVWDTRPGGRRWVLPPTPCIAAHPWRRYDGPILSSVWSKPHPRGLRHERAARGLWDRLRGQTSTP